MRCIRESIRSVVVLSKFNQRLFGVSEVGMGLKVIGAGLGEQERCR